MAAFSVLMSVMSPEEKPRLRCMHMRHALGSQVCIAVLGFPVCNGLLGCQVFTGMLGCQVCIGVPGCQGYIGVAHHIHLCLRAGMPDESQLSPHPRLQGNE